MVAVANRILLAVVFVTMMWMGAQAMQWHQSLTLLAKMNCADLEDYPNHQLQVITPGGAIWSCSPPVPVRAARR